MQPVSVAMRAGCCRFLILLLVVHCLSVLAQTKRAVPVQWKWLVVSTPDYIGPFRGKEPGFKAPILKAPLPTTLAVTAKDSILGAFEVIVTAKGTAELETVLTASSADVRAVAKQVVSRWRFTPASLDGKPIRVRLRVFLEGRETPGTR